MRDYAEKELKEGTRLSSIARHLIGLLNGQAGARQFRRLLTEESVKPGAGLDVLEAAIEVARRVEERRLTHLAA